MSGLSGVDDLQVALTVVRTDCPSRETQLRASATRLRWSEKHTGGHDSGDASEGSIQRSSL